MKHIIYNHIKYINKTKTLGKASTISKWFKSCCRNDKENSNKVYNIIILSYLLTLLLPTSQFGWQTFLILSKKILCLNDIFVLFTPIDKVNCIRKKWQKSYVAKMKIYYELFLISQQSYSNNWNYKKIDINRSIYLKSHT